MRKAVASSCQPVQLRPTIRARFASGVSIPATITSARCRAISILAGEVDPDGADPAAGVDAEAQALPTVDAEDAAFPALTRLALLRVPTRIRSPMRRRSIPEWRP